MRLLLALRLFGRVVGYRSWRWHRLVGRLAYRLVCRLVPGRWAFASRLLVSCGRLVCASRAVLLVGVRFAATGRCLLVMPSCRYVTRIVVCLIGIVSSSSLSGGAVRVFLRRLVDTPVISWSVAVCLVAAGEDAVLRLRLSDPRGRRFCACFCSYIPRRLIVSLSGEGVRLVSAWRCGVHSSRRGGD